MKRPRQHPVKKTARSLYKAMKSFTSIDIEALKIDPFEAIGQDWMLITAKKGDQVNTMTASWGGMGVLWNRRAAYIFVKEARFTKTFIDASERFSLCFFRKQYQDKLEYLGSVSGRDENKIKNVGFTLCEDQGVPFFLEADTVLVCKKLSQHPLLPEGFIDSSILPTWYMDGCGYHSLYVGEIEKVLLESM